MARPAHALDAARGRPAVAWRFLDGKPGHENQSRGLVQALCARRAFAVHDLPVPAPAAALRYWLAGEFPPAADLPAADLLIGAGHRTHLPMLAARRARGGRIVVLMRPSLPLGWFDLCLIPEHDRPPGRDGVVATRGVLNSVAGDGRHDPQRGLILVGGPSAHYRWDEAGLLSQIDAIKTRDGPHWTIADSRRTPAATAELLRGLDDAAFVSWRESGPEWLPRALARAGVVWISEDSVSMVYEALTSGAACGLLGVPRRRASRVVAGVQRLVRDGWVTPFAAWAEGAALGRPPAPFNEARRCAELIERRWLAA